MTREISITFSTVDFFGNDRETYLDIDTEAWTEEIELQADKADTGDVLNVTVGKAGPLETQDAVVEIVVLTPGYGGTVAYRYSTSAQDDPWQLGTPEQAIEHAADCYKTLNETDED